MGKNLRRSGHRRETWAQMGPQRLRTGAKWPQEVGYHWKAGEKGFQMTYSLSDNSPPGPTYTLYTIATWTSPDKARISAPLK